MLQCAAPCFGEVYVLSWLAVLAAVPLGRPVGQVCASFRVHVMVCELHALADVCCCACAASIGLLQGPLKHCYRIQNQALRRITSQAACNRSCAVSLPSGRF